MDGGLTLVLTVARRRPRSPYTERKVTPLAERAEPYPDYGIIRASSFHSVARHADLRAFAARPHRGRAAFRRYAPSRPTCPRSSAATTPIGLPEVSELQALRHYTNLSRKNFSIDTQFYPLGSCTMKYNPRACNSLAMLDGFLARHPYAPESLSQGFLSCMYELQEILADVTGMKGGVSLAPMAGAQGEFAGVAMIMAYHRHRGDLRAHRDHRARRRARHQSGDRDRCAAARCARSRRTPMATSMSKR